MDPDRIGSSRHLHFFAGLERRFEYSQHDFSIHIYKSTANNVLSQI